MTASATTSDGAAVFRAARSANTRLAVRSSTNAVAGLAAIVFSAVYLLSDIMEVAQGDFSTARLVLTYIGESAIPLFVLGLYAAQRPYIGRLGLLGAMAYAYSYVFFTSTVVFALAAHSRDYRDLSDQFGVWMIVHGAVMLLGGLAFGLAVLRAGVLPRWTGLGLIIGVVLVVTASGLPNLARTVAAAVPAVAFAGMGLALLRQTPSRSGAFSRTRRPGPAPRRRRSRGRRRRRADRGR